MTASQGGKAGTSPLAAGALHQSLVDVGHLLRRAGFGARPSEVLAASQSGVQATVNTLVAYDQIPEAPPTPPASVSDTPSRQSTDLAAWWLGYMLTTQRPLQEKMTLFWHGHFATGISKVASPAFMYGQNQMLRAGALARFDDLLTAVYKDPAMLIWLDGQRNISTAPNENFGREVMELFTLGRGNYTEDDVHANARAFTGWRIDANGQAVFIPRLHDSGVKTLLGQTGNWTSDDAVRILCAHPATGPFLASKLWRFFASDTPPASAIDTLSGVYYDSDHSIRAMVTALFTMPEFYAPDVRQSHVKSPVEFAITAIRSLGLHNIDMTLVARYLVLLGQELFNPPNVGGWSGGANWISPATMLGRFNFASRLTGDLGLPGAIDGPALLQASGADTTEALMFFVANILGMDLTGPTSAAMMSFLGKGSIDRIDPATTVQGLVHLALASPEYQLS